MTFDPNSLPEEERKAFYAMTDKQQAAYLNKLWDEVMDPKNEKKKETTNED